MDVAPLPNRRRAPRAALLAVAAFALAGCFPHYDWRDVRPDCAKAWCGFVASFPARVTSVTREIPVGSARLPLSLTVASVDRVTFAVGAFELREPGDAAAARAVLERKLLDDVGAAGGRRGSVAMRTVDHGEVATESFEVDGRSLAAVARFAEHRGRLVEVVVIGPADVLAKPSGRQAIETFVTSLKLD